MPTPAQISPRVAAALARHPGRPLVIAGPTGAGKTTLLRALAGKTDRAPVWCPAVDLAGWVVDAIRDGCYPALRASLAADPRPLVVEHLEDLRGKPRTRAELRELLKSSSEHRSVLLTLTRARRDRDVRRWLRGWAEVVSLD
jgi:chromosomal replication initiation ATPase DnaA